MTHPEASPDGTGTQTDEVREALAYLRKPKITAPVPYGIASLPEPDRDLTRAASVLSAEIERLTRRLEELETALRPFARTADLLEKVAPDAGYSPDTDALIAQRPREGTRGAVTVGDCRRARAALAAADERAVTIRTPDQDTAP